MEKKFTKGELVVEVDQFQNYKIIANSFYLGEARSKHDALLFSKSPKLFEMLENIIDELEGEVLSTGINETINNAKQLLTEATQV